MRTASSRRENKTVPPVPSKKKKVLSLPVVKEIIYRPVLSVVKNYMHRPVPWSKNIYTAPSRREVFYLPSRPVVTIFTSRPVPPWQFLFTVPACHETKCHCTVPSRPVEKIHTHRPVPSRPIQATIIFIILPSRHVPSSFFPAKHVKTVPSCPVSNITSHEKP